MATKSTNIYTAESINQSTATTDNFERFQDYMILSENNSSALYSSTTTTSAYTYIYNNESLVNGSYGVVDVTTPRIFSEIPFWVVPCYGVIFITAIAGNFLVISTLIQNRRMRTITNVFLLNLAISDMLLGVLCMPVTLVGTLLRHFIFGEFFCKLIQFSQAASVAVSSWTLVAISCERYYAICHPLRSRTWQTINHAYRIIGFIWFGSIICMTPIAAFSQLMPTSRQGLRKCREQWPEDTIAYEHSYNIFLVLVLLLLPLFILCVAYILITRTLYVGMRTERALIFGGHTASKNIRDGKLNDDNNASTLESIATMTTSTRATAAATAAVQPTILAGFSLRMSFRCHRRSVSTENCSTRSGDHDMASQTQTQNDISYQTPNQYSQQKHQPKQQELNCYDESVGGDIFHKSCSTSKSKSSQSLFGLQMLPCVEISAQQLETQQMQQQQHSKQMVRRHPSNATRYQQGCNNNDSHSAMSNQCISILYSEQQEKRCVLRANSSQFNCNHFQQNQHSVLQQASMQAQQTHINEDRRKLNSKPSLRVMGSTLRRSNETKNLESKKRVVKMLFVLVLEFFICWTPLYVINTVAMFSGPAIYEYIDYTTICFFQLLAYSSSCCNPITYCFMNPNFRRAFLDNFKGWHLRSTIKAFGSNRTSVGFSSWYRRRRKTATASERVARGSDTKLSTFMTQRHTISLTNNLPNKNNNNNTSILHDGEISVQRRET